MESKETVKGTIDHTKKSIVIDNILNQYGNSFTDNVIEVDNFEDIIDDNVMCICKFSFNCDLGGYQMFELTWGHQFQGNSLSREQLYEIAYVNNLDSVLDYDTFNLPLMFLFPLLECVRLDKKTKNIYIVGNPPSGTIYISLK